MNIKTKEIVSFNNFCEHSHKIKGGKVENFIKFASLVNGEYLSFKKSTKENNFLFFKEWDGY